MHNTSITRRSFARYSGLSSLGALLSGWMPRLAAELAESGIRAPRSCILLWMSGGPSQLETFDPKEGQPNGGPTKAIDTRVPGIRIAENLPKIAGIMEHLAVIRSMSTKEGDHTRATHFMRTGYLPQGPIQYPSLGAFLGKQLKKQECDLPSYVSINPFRAFSPAAYGPGFLGPAWSPLVVASETDKDRNVSFQVRNLKSSDRLATAQVEARLRLLNTLETSFLAERPDAPGSSHLQSYEQAVRMMKSNAVSAFQLAEEDDVLRDAYGRSTFGQGCLLARRLIERGVSFVEVSLTGVDGSPGAGWDTHAENFTTVKSLCQILDPAWATLMTDLKQRGLLANTLVVWMGEFGRTPQINANTGRDHWPGSWSTVLGGAGLKGGQAYGVTSDDGTEIQEHPVTVQNLIATICRALNLDPMTTNLSNIGRPIPLADHGATAIDALLG